jgi:phosphatidylethanolamine/phosphatidyl-N-methylethanolamine N-methyltransferase
MRERDDFLRMRKPRSKPEEALEFFRGFLRDPQQVGSVIPSSRFLERRLVAISEVSKAGTVVELGPGTGGTTRALLRSLPPSEKLLAIEIDRHFARRLRMEIDDPRLIVHEGSAEEIAATLLHYALPAPEAVISGIPFSTMPRQTGVNILRAVWAALAPGGRFVAYQLRDRVAVLGRSILGRPETAVELLNVPPIRVYRWRKP